MTAPGELGLGRAYVAGDIDFEGDLFGALDRHRRPPARSPTPGCSPTWPAPSARSRLRAAAAAARRRPASTACATRRPATPRPSPTTTTSRTTSTGLVLGPSMTYSCAVWETPGVGLEAAQAAKHELVSPEARPSSPACASSTSAAAGAAWCCTPPPSTASRAVGRHHLRSARPTWPRSGPPKAGLARPGRDPPAGLPRRRRRPVRRHQLDRHVRARRAGAAARVLREPPLAAAPRGPAAEPRHRPPGQAPSRRPVGLPRAAAGAGAPSSTASCSPTASCTRSAPIVSAMQQDGFEVRHLESLREHYGLTLRAWVANLEASWDEAVALHDRGPGPGVAALHGGVGRRVRAGPHPGAPGARREARPRSQRLPAASVLLTVSLVRPTGASRCALDRWRDPRPGVAPGLEPSGSRTAGSCGKIRRSSDSDEQSGVVPCGST